MKIIEKRLDSIIWYPVSDEIDPSQIMYFDIETTGLSADTSYLYLIGMLVHKDGCPYMVQWLVDSINEEKDMLVLFFKELSQYKLLIHYNGQTFDVPYLVKKARRYHLNVSFDHIIQLDIYREIQPFKKLLPLPDMKQKTVESYLGFQREDIFSGEDLIEVFTQYIGYSKIEQLNPNIAGRKAEALRYALLLHNQDDLIGLASCCLILYCKSLFKGGFSSEFKEIDENTETAVFNLVPKIQLNKDISDYLLHNPIIFQLPPISTLTETSPILHIETNRIHLKVPYYSGKLKYFFVDYKEYYYLPEEDIAVHKSIGEYVDKACRQKAKKSNCYQAKMGVFLPQYNEIVSPAFKTVYNEKISYFELTDDFKNSELITHYIKDMLR